MDTMAVNDGQRRSQAMNRGPQAAITRQVPKQKYYEDEIEKTADEIEKAAAEQANEQAKRVVKMIKNANKSCQPKVLLGETNKLALRLAESIHHLFEDVAIDAATALEDVAIVSAGPYSVAIHTNGIMNVDKNLKRVLSSKSINSVIRQVSSGLR